MSDIFPKIPSSGFKFLDEFIQASIDYIGHLVMNVAGGVCENMGIKNPDTIAKNPPLDVKDKTKELKEKRLLIKAFLDGLPKRLKEKVKKILKNPIKAFKIFGGKIYDLKKGFWIPDWKKIEKQIDGYFKEHGEIAEEITVKAFCLSLAAAEMEARAGAINRNMDYETILKKRFNNRIPSNIPELKKDFRITENQEKFLNESYSNAAQYVTKVQDDVRESIRKNVIKAHQEGLTASQLASNLYWQAEDNPDLKNYTVQSILRDWHRVAVTELAFITGNAILSGTDSEAAESMENPEKAIYFIFTGSGRCDWCAPRQGEILRQIPQSIGAGSESELLSDYGINDEFTDKAVWIGKNNIGRKKADWLIASPSHPWCFSKDTEVLTNNGWKLFKDVNKNDKIFSMNPENRNIEYVDYINKIQYHYKGDMISLSARGYNSLVTPNHKIPIERRVYKNCKRIKIKEFRDAEDLLDIKEFYIPRTGNWEGIKTNNNDRLLASLYGWYVSKGNVTKRFRNSYMCNISQDVKNINNRNKIEKLLNDLGIKYSKGKNGFCFYGEYAKRFYNECPGKSYEKKIPEFIKNMDIAGIKSFLESYCLGDGYIQKVNCFGYDSISKVYYTSSKNLVSDVSELLLKIGKACHISITNPKGTIKKFRNGIYKSNYDVYCICESNSNNVLFHNFNRSKIEKIEYDDMVYCLELERNHVLLTKRGNDVCWSGNCLCRFVRIYPTVQEYDPKTKTINYKSKVKWDKFLPAEYLERKKQTEAEIDRMKKEQESDLKQGIHRKKIDYVDYTAKPIGADSQGNRIVEWKEYLYKEVPIEKFNEERENWKTGKTNTIPVSIGSPDHRRLFGNQ